MTRVVGAGGTGVVYEATGQDGRPVAVKALLSLQEGRDDKAMARFRREGDLTAGLDSPYIVSALASGVDLQQDVAFIAMPLLTGESLHALVERQGALPPQAAVRVAMQACSALAVAHEAGIIHRDIKPSNLFVERQGAGGCVVKVLDFGMAKLLASDTTITMTGSMMGTPFFLSPEQAADAKRVDERADIWSLGATLYYLLSGKRPYARAENLMELIVLLNHEEVSSLQRHAPWLDPQLVRVVHGALLRDLDARCPNVPAFQAALREHAGDGLALSASMLTPLLPSHRARVSPVAALPHRWSEVAAGA